ncbi:MAG: endonuclease/exonuclease/phosphatase family protein [Sphingobacteriales bacterium]|nr:MAG: endonuclease/exonuclease/phosphatase family protein [Sphingobacteriales bacterium]
MNKFVLTNSGNKKAGLFARWAFYFRVWLFTLALLLPAIELQILGLSPSYELPNASPSVSGSAAFNSQELKSLKIISWNLYNFGSSKNEAHLKFVANVVKSYDLVALQEISTSFSGPQAVARLSEELNRLGEKWDYLISNPTSGEGSERYAFLFKTKSIRLLGRGWLLNDLKMDEKIAREPYLARFKINEKSLLIANFHAIPVTKRPAAEILLLEVLPDLYPNDNLLLLGDFNLSEKNEVFDGLKCKGIHPVLKNQKTSLKRKPDAKGRYLYSEYDNIFYKSTTLGLIKSGVVDFVPDFENLESARKISDHLPVWCEIFWKK